MAGKDLHAPAALLDEAQRRLADHVLKAVDEFASLKDDKAVISAERRARLLATLGRAVTNIRQAGPKPDRDPPPPANQNAPAPQEGLDQADEFDGAVDDVDDAELRADIAARLERLAQEFPQYGLVVCAGDEPPEPGAIRVAASGPARAAA